MLELAPGTTLGGYVVSARIGRGGMASVYQAHHLALDRQVAIKVMEPSLADQHGFLERFRREARAASRLRHPNILTVYDFGEQDDIAFMVTELLPGGSLMDRLGRKLPATEILRLLRGIGAALDAAHGAGLIHRDVKPSNILFTRDGEPVLADFGIARLMESQENLTLQGTLIGTPHYLAPEMASGDKVTPLSDLYSLGVVLYEMLVGEPPFPRPTPLAIIRAHVHEPPPLLSRRDPTIPREIELVVNRTLAKLPSERYQSGVALAAAFEDAMLSRDPPTPRPGTIPPVNVPPSLPTSTYQRDSAAQIPPTYVRTDGYAAQYPAPQPQQWDENFQADAPSTVGAHWAGPHGSTERLARPAPHGSTGRVVRPAPSPRRRGITARGLAIVVAVALLLSGATYYARSTDFFSRIGLGGGGTATVTPTAAAVATLTPTPNNPFGAVTPGAIVSPTATPTRPGASPSPAAGELPVVPPAGDVSPVPAVTPTATPTSTPRPTRTPTPVPPTPTPDLLRGPLGIQIVSPVEGTPVAARPPITGRRIGYQGTDDHLWLLTHPDGNTDNWWPHKSEVVPNRDGRWQINDIEIGGPSGSRHVLVIGVVDAEGHARILAQIRDNPDQPFSGGQPEGFLELVRTTVVKR